MELYSLLREFADSWMLLALTTFYIGVFVWAFRPGSRAVHDEISQIPLREDDLAPWPETTPAPDMQLGCAGGCAGCPRAKLGAKA